MVLDSPPLPTLLHHAPQLGRAQAGRCGPLPCRPRCRSRLGSRSLETHGLRQGAGERTRAGAEAGQWHWPGAAAGECGWCVGGSVGMLPTSHLQTDNGAQQGATHTLLDGWRHACMWASPPSTTLAAGLVSLPPPAVRVAASGGGGAWCCWRPLPDLLCPPLRLGSAAAAAPPAAAEQAATTSSASTARSRIPPPGLSSLKHYASSSSPCRGGLPLPPAGARRVSGGGRAWRGQEDWDCCQWRWRVLGRVRLLAQPWCVW